MAFTPKEWKDGALGGTPITAASLRDLESRLAEIAERLEVLSANAVHSRQLKLDPQGNPYLLNEEGANEMIYIMKPSASNTVRVDREAGKLYKISEERPGAVTVNFNALIQGSQMASIAIFVGPTENELVEQNKFELGMSVTASLSGVLGGLVTAGVKINTKNALRADVPPNQYYKIVTKTEGSAVEGTAVGMTVNYVKERIF